MNLSKQIISSSQWNVLCELLSELNIKYTYNYDATCKPLIFNQIQIEPFQVTYYLREDKYEQYS